MLNGFDNLFELFGCVWILMFGVSIATLVFLGWVIIQLLQHFGVI